MQKQLKLTKTQLEKIGFKRHLYGDLDPLDPAIEMYEIEFAGGCFSYNVDNAKHRWSQRVKFSGNYHTAQVDIQQAKELFNVLRVFKVKHDFYVIK